MSLNEIPEYQSPNASKAAPHIDLIAAMRQKKWTYQSIMKRLFDDHQIEISYNALWEFCQRNNIVKGKGIVSDEPKPRISEEVKIEELPAEEKVNETPKVQNFEDLVDEAEKSVNDKSSETLFRKL